MKRALIAGGLIFAGLVAWWVYKTLTTEEERPPIVVNEGSLIIANETRGSATARNWARPGSANQTWKMQHDKGKDAKEYDVTATATNTVCNAGRGSEVIVLAGNYTLRFYIDPHPGGKKKEPALDFDGPLAPQNSNPARKTLTFPGASDIRQITVTGGAAPCKFSADDVVRVELTIRY